MLEVQDPTAHANTSPDAKRPPGRPRRDAEKPPGAHALANARNPNALPCGVCGKVVSGEQSLFRHRFLIHGEALNLRLRLPPELLSVYDAVIAGGVDTAIARPVWDWWHAEYAAGRHWVVSDDFTRDHSGHTDKK